MIINRTDHHKKKISHVGLIASSGLKTVKKTKLCGWGQFSSRSILNGLRSSEITKKTPQTFSSCGKITPGISVFGSQFSIAFVNKTNRGKKRVALHLDFFLVTLTYLNVIAFELFAV